MPSDDESVGLSINWSEGSVSAKIKSRFVSAIDSLLAVKVERWGIPAKRIVDKENALIASERLLVETATAVLANDMKRDPAVARNVLRILAKAEEEAASLQACLQLTFEDLNSRSQTSGEDKGPDELDPEFLGRWASYAEGAKTELVRERWGRVLAAEIANPETFSLKTLRIIDELEPDTASLFQKLCACRLESWIPTCVSEVHEKDMQTLIEAGLVVSSGLGRNIIMRHRKDDEGVSLFSLELNFGAIVIDGAAALNRSVPASPLYVSPREGQVGLRIFELTRQGSALASIIETDQQATLLKTIIKLQSYYGVDKVSLYKPGMTRGEWVPAALDG